MSSGPSMDSMSRSNMLYLISKADSATEDQKFKCSKYPYCRVVGQLMYEIVHTMIGIVFTERAIKVR